MAALLSRSLLIHSLHSEHAQAITTAWRPIHHHHLRQTKGRRERRVRRRWGPPATRSGKHGTPYRQRQRRCGWRTSRRRESNMRQAGDGVRATQECFRCRGVPPQNPVYGESHVASLHCLCAFGGGVIGLRVSRRDE
ncbi:hypothetical protein FB451DRAFT_406043 [Mycena latifolia]|nr:hypothetical protein FB451DRAFT_406043 [Mycena latifolia]